LHTVSEVSSRGGVFLADDSSEDAEEVEAMLGIDDSVWAAALCVPQETVKKVSKENTRQKSFFMTVRFLTFLMIGLPSILCQQRQKIKGGESLRRAGRRVAFFVVLGV
ncbi:MAG: hypothetical protein ACLSX2_02995, partial [Christensenellaceae bacterium]